MFVFVFLTMILAPKIEEKLKDFYYFGIPVPNEPPAGGSPRFILRLSVVGKAVTVHDRFASAHRSVYKLYINKT